jgi:hypothetical protein
MSNMKNFSRFILFIILPFQLPAQQKNYTINMMTVSSGHKVIVNVDNQPFTEFIYSDSLEKPVLYPIYAADGQLITRGFPIAPRAGEPTDHPHHVGLWLTYENVNGLDFWNNSFAIPAEKKHLYGWIKKTDGIAIVKNGGKGVLNYKANWVDQQNNLLLAETTDFIFSANAQERIIDRVTRLSARQDISFTDAKDGLLGLRVTHELELPSAQPKTFTDNKGNTTNVAADTSVTGNYLTSEGKQGDSAWGTRATWCLLYGKKNNDSISIAIIDHPKNPGYPTYWHARGYGLFAANPLGQKIFSNGKEVLNFSLKKGETVVFRYRIVIASGKERLSVRRINELAEIWAKQK